MQQKKALKSQNGHEEKTKLMSKLRGRRKMEVILGIQIYSSSF